MDRALELDPCSASQGFPEDFFFYLKLMFVAGMLVVASSACGEVRTARGDAIRRGLDDSVSLCTNESRLLLGDVGIDLLPGENKWDECRFAAVAFIRGMFVGRKASQAVAAINHFFDCQEQEAILNQSVITPVPRLHPKPRPIEN